MSNSGIQNSLSAVVELLNNVSDVPRNELVNGLTKHYESVLFLQRYLVLKQTIKRNKEKLSANTKKQRKLKTMKHKLATKLRTRFDDIKRKDKEILFNPEGTRVDVNRVLEHHSMVIPFISIPPDYRLSDKYLPCSFDTCKVETYEIESSNMYFKYKQNKEYRKLAVPTVKYLNNSDKHVVKIVQNTNLSNLLEVDGRISLQVFVEGDEDIGMIKSRIHYTLDGSNPSLTNFIDATAEMININKNCVLKLRAFKPGWIESEIRIIEIRVIARQENDYNNIDLQNMIRPEHEYDISGESMNDELNSDFNDNIFDNDNFASWHDHGTYSTPRD